MDVAQWAEQLLSTPEICSSNQSHRQILITVNIFKFAQKDENKGKRGWEWPIKKLCYMILFSSIHYFIMIEYLIRSQQVSLSE